MTETIETPETTESEVTAQVKIKLTELEVQKAVILEARDVKIKAARDEYATALKDINIRIVKANRMLRTSKDL